MPAEQSISDGQSPVATTPIGEFLSHLFNKLDEKSVKYCVLRGYEWLPNHVGYDVDLIVAENNVKTYISILHEVMRFCGWSLVRIAHRFSFLAHYMVYEENGTFVLLKIDIHARIHWREIIRANESIIFNTRKLYNGFWIASSGCEAAILLFKEYLHFGRVKEKHKQRIAQLSKEDPENFLAAIEPYFGRGISRFALECAQKEDWETFEKNVAKLRRTLIVRALMRRPIGQMTDWVRFICGHFSDKVLYPSGFFVCLIGPDGSGKTTISHGLERDMTDVFSKVHYFHGHFGILPPLKLYYNFFARLLGMPEKKVPSAITIKNSDISPIGLLRALTHILYYALDYFIGHIIIRYAKSQGQFVIFDRYFYDYLINRSHSKVPSWLSRAILWFLPKPDVLFWLENKPEIIHERKPELTISQIMAQCKVCRNLVGKHPSAVSILTDDDSDATLHHVREAIFQSMAKRVNIRGR